MVESAIYNHLNHHLNSDALDLFYSFYHRSGCKKIEMVGNKYHIYCVVDYSKYGNITYFCFYPNNENKFYVFTNDKDKIGNLFENNETIFVLDESLLYYIGDK